MGSLSKEVFSSDEEEEVEGLQSQRDMTISTSWVERKDEEKEEKNHPSAPVILTDPAQKCPSSGIGITRNPGTFDYEQMNSILRNRMVRETQSQAKNLENKIEKEPQSKSNANEGKENNKKSQFSQNVSYLYLTAFTIHFILVYLIVNQHNYLTSLEKENQNLRIAQNFTLNKLNILMSLIKAHSNKVDSHVIELDFKVISVQNKISSLERKFAKIKNNTKPVKEKNENENANHNSNLFGIDPYPSVIESEENKRSYSERKVKIFDFGFDSDTEIEEEEEKYQLKHFHDSISKLTQTEFIHQTRETWLQILNTISPTLDIFQEPNRPGVLMILSPPHLNPDFLNCFATKLAQIIMLAGEENSHEDIFISPKIITPTWLESIESSDKIEDEILYYLKNYGKSIIFQNIEEIINQDLLLIFNNLCDEKNATDKRANFIFTISIPSIFYLTYEWDNSKAKEIAQKYLDAAWSKIMTADKRKVIISKITSNVILLNEGDFCH